MLTFIVGIYLFGLLGIGWWCHRNRIGGMTDFLIAGRSLGPWLGAATLAATHFGGGALLGGASYGFQYGAAGIWYGVATGIGLLLLSFLTAGRFRELALYTVPDYLAHRYGGKAVRILGALLSLVALVGILAAQVNAARGAFEILGVTGVWAAVLATTVFVAYTALGGLWAAAISDLVQVSIAGVGVVIAAWAVYASTEQQGGLKNLLAEAEVGTKFLETTGPGISWVLWLVIPTVMYTLIGQDFYQRLFACRSKKVARVSALSGGLFLVAISFFPAFIGAGARALSDIEDSTQAIPWVLQNLVPPVLGGLILAAILAAIMSSADSLLTAATSHLVKDLWIEVLHPNEDHDEKQLLAMARMSTVALGVISLIIGVAVPGIVGLLIVSYTLYTAGVFIPVLGGVLWPRATRTGALAALFGGSLVATIGLIFELDLAGMPTEIWSAGVSLLIFVLVSLMTDPPRGVAANDT